MTRRIAGWPPGLHLHRRLQPEGTVSLDGAAQALGRKVGVDQSAPRLEVQRCAGAGVARNDFQFRSDHQVRIQAAIRDGLGLRAAMLPLRGSLRLRTLLGLLAP